MNALRLPIAIAAVLTTAAALGSSCFSGPAYSDCAIPTASEKAADGGPDPCHCAPPPSLNIETCPCLSGTPQDLDFYDACMTLYRGEMDAGPD